MRVGRALRGQLGELEARLEALLHRFVSSLATPGAARACRELLHELRAAVVLLDRAFLSH
jgi:hypothetical protein